MAKPNMLPILALGAAALFLMKKKGEPEASTNGEEAKANGNGANGNGTKENGTANGNGNGNGNGAPEEEPADGLPLNVTFMDLGPVQSGVRVGLGEDLTDDEQSGVVGTVAIEALQRPNLPFSVTPKDGPGIPIAIVVNGANIEYWAEDLTYLAPTLKAALDQHYPLP